jgi:hypothetical protein
VSCLPGKRLTTACIKYFTKKQAVQIKTASGDEKEYSVSEVDVSTKGAKSVAGLEDGLASLAIGKGELDVYEMDWRTKIHLQDGTDTQKSGGSQAAAKNVCVSSGRS